MHNRPPATIGMALAEVDTPALLVDLEAFEHNLAQLANTLKQDFPKIRLRPHAKTHKCAAIALQQIAHGAVGVCCQKVSEAEALVYAGVPDVLVSNQVIGPTKIARLAALARQASIGVCVDHSDTIRTLNQAAQAANSVLKVLVEIDVGARRCGVPPGQPALELAQHIADKKHAQLRFEGLQAYNGSAQHIRNYNQRREAIDASIEQTQQTVDLLRHHGLSCNTVGGAGTGTFPFEAGSGVFNELQAGSYIFMDADYGRNLQIDGAFFNTFQHSLFIYTTVMSKATADYVVVDAGLKALSVDSGMPQVYDMPAVTYSRVSDEHGILELDDDHSELQVGDKLHLIPGHCDPTVNLHDWYVGVRNGRVETLWPVTARGALF